MRSLARLGRLFLRSLQSAVLAAFVALLLFLPFAGRFFVTEDPLERGDLIFVLAGHRIERWLEGYDLFRERWAPRLVVSPGPVLRIEAALAAKGARYPREGDLARDALIALGVPAGAVTVLPDGVDNTAAEAAALRSMILPAAGPQTVIVVTSPYHTRRTAYAFRRAFAGTNVRLIVRATRYSDSEPERWWRHRSDARYILSELPKLGGYLLGLAE